MTATFSQTCRCPATLRTDISGPSKPVHQEHGEGPQLLSQRHRCHQAHRQELPKNAREWHPFWPMGTPRKRSGELTIRQRSGPRPAAKDAQQKTEEIGLTPPAGIVAINTRMPNGELRIALMCVFTAMHASVVRDTLSFFPGNVLQNCIWIRVRSDSTLIAV